MANFLMNRFDGRVTIQICLFINLEDLLWSLFWLTGNGFSFDKF